MAINFMSFIETNDERVMISKNDNVKITFDKETNEECERTF